MDSVGSPASLLARWRVARELDEDGFEGEVGDIFAAVVMTLVGDKDEAGEVGDLSEGPFPVIGIALIDNEDVTGRLRGELLSFEGGITTGVDGPIALFPRGAPVIAGDTGADSVIIVGRPISTTDGSRS